MNIDTSNIEGRYPEGTRIRLIRMQGEENRYPEGICGTVLFVDDIGQIHMRWDTGGGLALIPGVDVFEKADF